VTLISHIFHRFISLPGQTLIELNTRRDVATVSPSLHFFLQFYIGFQRFFIMGDINVRGGNVKTTTGGYSDQDDGGVRPKGLCHVAFFKQRFPSLIFTLRKASCPLYSP
jgi:hypothetical protein